MGMRLVFGLLALMAPAVWADADSEDDIKRRIGPGNPVAGKAKSETELCQGCHGEAGLSLAVGVPNLAGQQAAYLAKQLRDFRSQDRRHRIMTAMAEGLAEADIDDIAAYFASLPRMRSDATPADPAIRELFLYGDVERGLNACVSCHELDGKGRLANGIAYPRIGGQTRGYLQVQLLNWKTGNRSNSPQGVMSKATSVLTEAEISGLASYLSGL